MNMCMVPLTLRRPGSLFSWECDPRMSGSMSFTETASNSGFAAAGDWAATDGGAATILRGDMVMTSAAAAAHASATGNAPARPRRCWTLSTAPTRVARSARFAIASRGDFADNDFADNDLADND